LLRGAFTQARPIEKLIRIGSTSTTNVVVLFWRKTLPVQSKVSLVVAIIVANTVM